MPFPLAIRSPRQFADELYPAVTPAGSPLPVFLDGWDGAVRTLAPRSLAIHTQHVGHVSEGAVVRGDLELLVTDSRVVIVGGRPTPDSVQAGHIPLDRIVAVGGSATARPFRGDALRLVIQLDTGEYRVLTFDVGSDVDVHELAQDIARRTARHWLDVHGGGELLHTWRAVADAERLTAARGEFALHSMPEHRRVASRGADQLCVPA